MWHTDTVHEIELVKAQDMGLQFFQTFSYAVVHFGYIPAECIARVVGDDQTILYERPLEVAPLTHWQLEYISLHRATGCLTQINNKTYSISSGIVLIPFCKPSQN